MPAPVLESIRKNLFDKRDRINEWLRATPLSKKEVFLGPSTEQAVYARLDLKLQPIAGRLKLSAATILISLSLATDFMGWP